MSTKYKVEEIEVGILTKEVIRSVDMSRARFVELVEQTLEDGEFSQEVADELLPVAHTMPRFPLGSWINPTRGCGCVIGEYLVASKKLDRAILASEFDQGPGYAIKTVETLLFDNTLRKSLMQFGSDIDGVIMDELKDRLVDDNSKDIYMHSWDEADVYVDSVEIID